MCPRISIVLPPHGDKHSPCDHRAIEVFRTEARPGYTGGDKLCGRGRKVAALGAARIAAHVGLDLEMMPLARR